MNVDELLAGTDSLISDIEADANTISDTLISELSLHEGETLETEVRPRQFSDTSCKEIHEVVYQAMNNAVIKTLALAIKISEKGDK